jgi:hypothetical protein
MLAYVITVVMVLHGHPVKFHYISQARFGDIDKCMERGDRAVRAMARQVQRYHKKPTVKVELDCAPQVTAEI